MLINIMRITELVLAVIGFALWFLGLYFVFEKQFIMSVSAFILFAGFIYSSGRMADLRAHILQKRIRLLTKENAPYQDD
jgi:hypothetical protein